MYALISTQRGCVWSQDTLATQNQTPSGIYHEITNPECQLKSTKHPCNNENDKNKKILTVTGLGPAMDLVTLAAAVW